MMPHEEYKGNSGLGPYPRTTRGNCGTEAESSNARRRWDRRAIASRRVEPNVRHPNSVCITSFATKLQGGVGARG